MTVLLALRRFTAGINWATWTVGFYTRKYYLAPAQRYYRLVVFTFGPLWLLWVPWFGPRDERPTVS